MTAAAPRTAIDRETAIDELLAKQEIRDALMRYSRGIDLLDPDLVKSAYHPDAYDDHGTFKGNAHEFAEHVIVGLSRLECTEHFLGNSHIEVEGDRAYSETYHVAYHRIPAATGTAWPRTSPGAGATWTYSSGAKAVPGSSCTAPSSTPGAASMT